MHEWWSSEKIARMTEPTSTLEPPDEVDAASEDACALRASSAQNAPIAAVILAAGEGTRLGRPSKPLTRVAGVTLLERAVAAARGAGITRVLVVLGHAKEEVARFVTERGLDVELVDVNVACDLTPPGGCRRRAPS